MIGERLDVLPDCTVLHRPTVNDEYIIVRSENRLYLTLFTFSNFFKL